MKKLRGNSKLKSFQVIGDELGISKVTVKKEHDRAIAKIMQELEKFDGETRNLILGDIFETNIFSDRDDEHKIIR